MSQLSCLNLSLTKHPKPELQSFSSEVPDPKVHTKYPKEDCEQRPVLIPEVVSTDSWLNLSLAKHPKRELQSFDCEQRPVLIPETGTPVLQ